MLADEYVLFAEAFRRRPPCLTARTRRLERKSWKCGGNRDHEDKTARIADTGWQTSYHVAKSVKTDRDHLTPTTRNLRGRQVACRENPILRSRIRTSAADSWRMSLSRKCRAIGIRAFFGYQPNAEVSKREAIDKRPGNVDGHGVSKAFVALRVGDRHFAVSRCRQQRPCHRLSSRPGLDGG